MRRSLVLTLGEDTPPLLQCQCEAYCTFIAEAFVSSRWSTRQNTAGRYCRRYFAKNVAISASPWLKEEVQTRVLHPGSWGMAGWNEHRGYVSHPLN